MDTPTSETTHVVPQFDYKNVDLLSEYVNPHGRMYNRRRSGLSAREQRQFATATKRARFMALMPYIAR